MKLPPINKKTLYVAGGFVLLVIVVIVVYNYIMKHKPAKLPHETDWGRDLTKEESATISRITVELYNDMDGWNLSGHDNKIYKETASLNERLLVGVGNFFRDKYKESLIEWLKGENFFGEADEFSKIIIARLSTLGVQ